MMKEFEIYYNAFNELQARYEANRGDKEIIENLRTAYRQLEKDINDRGRDFTKMYELFASMKKRGNDYIDISDPHDCEDPEKLISMFRSFGVSRFVFASGWSSAKEDAWSFIQQGCSLAGMVEINGKHREIWTDEFEKVHGFLFKIS